MAFGGGAMLLSQILPKSPLKIEYQLINEKLFEALGLIASEPSKSYCIFLDDDKYIDQIHEDVTMVITTPGLKETMVGRKFGLCIVENPRITFFELHNYMSTTKGYQRTKYDTTIGENCHIHSLACIAKHNVTIGNNVTIEEFVSIKENTVIGDNTIIRAGSVIGGQGFEFKRNKDNIESVAHAGGVKIDHDVEIQYSTMIDKAIYPWDNTEIGAFTKIDNLVHVGHAAKIRKSVMIVAHAGIGGRTEINNGTWIGFGAIIKNGLIIGKNARANMGAIVTKNIDDNTSVTGNFAIEHHRFIKELKERSHEWNSEI